MKPNILSFVLLSYCMAYAESRSIVQKMIEPRISYEYSSLSEGNIGNTEGSLSVEKNRLQINNELFGISYNHWDFDWNSINQLPFGDKIHTPIDELHGLEARITLPKKIDPNWFWLSSLTLKSTFENEMSRSYGINLLSFLSYRFNDDHSIQMGAFANYHPTSTLALPVMSYSYREKFNEGWQFILGFPRTYVGYHYNENTLIKLGMIFSQSLVRLSNSSVIEKGGYVEAKDYLSNLGIRYTINEQLTFSADLLYSLKREFTIYNAHGDKIQNNSINNVPGVTIQLMYAF